MKRTQLLCLALALVPCALTGNASVMLYTFGANFDGTPNTLNNMTLTSASVTQQTVGDGNTGFNGGLVYANNLLYAIGNDNTGVSTLYSMTTSGLDVLPVSTGFNTAGDALGVPFQNGLTAVGNTFYAIGEDENLYQIGAGTSTFVQSLNPFGGNYAGLAWDPALNEFFAIVDAVNFGDFHGDFLVKFQLGGSASLALNLTHFDGAPVGTHLGGLADGGGGILYDIYTNTNDVNLTGELEQINLDGTPSASTLYDTGIPLAQNAGIAIVTPEPAPAVEIGAGIILVCCIFRRARIGNRRPQVAADRCK